MEDEKIHPLVELVLARMESHPEEFGNSYDGPTEDRWWRIRETIQSHGTEEERAVFRAAMREIDMNAGHEWMMDELLNGEDRRRQEREVMMQAQQRAQLGKAQAQLQTLQAQYGSQLANTITVTGTNAPGDIYANMKKALGI